MLLNPALLAASEGTPQQNLAPGPYQLLPISNSSSCADVNGASTANGTSVQSWTCGGLEATNQLWSLVPVSTPSGNGYTIVSQNSGACLDVSNISLADGALLQQYQCLGASQLNQLWQLYPFGSSYELVSLNSGKCLDLPHGDSTNGNQLIQWSCGHGTNPNQLWNLNPTSPSAEGTPQQNLAPGPYQLLPISNSSSCADVNGVSKANSAAVQIWTCGDATSTNQLWSLVPVSTPQGNGYTVVSQNSGACLDVSNVSLADGALLQQYQCLGASQLNQIWQLYLFGSSYELVSLNSGKCLDLPHGDSTNGNQFIQWSCGHGTNPNQLWNLNSMAASPTPTALAPTTVINTSTNLQATPTSAVTGQAVVLTARVAGGSGVPSGNVSFFDGAATIGASPLDANGAAAITATGMTNGAHLLTAQYTGSSVYAVSTSQPLQVNVAENATGEQALPADTFVDSIGVATHLAYDNTPYSTQWPQVFRELQSLGIRHIRDGFYNWPASSTHITEHQALASAGIKCTYVIAIDSTTTPQIIQSFASKVQDLEALEAPNECDAGSNCGGGGTTGIQNAVSFLPTIYSAGQALSVPVLGPSFTVASSYVTAGNIASEITFNNLHVYFGGRNPGSLGWGDGDAQGHSYGSLDWWIDQGNIDAPNVPSVITESGYMTYPQTNIPYTITDSVAASYIPRTLLLAFNHGIKRTFLYEFLDEVSSPAYGLLRSDLSEKPAFTAVKTLSSLLSDPGSSFSPGKLEYTITGADSTLTHTLLQKRDGSFWLILWSEQSSYNPETNTPIAVTPQSVTIQLRGPAIATQVVQLDNTGNAATTPVTGSGTTLTLSINDQLSVVHITPP